MYWGNLLSPQLVRGMCQVIKLTTTSENVLGLTLLFVGGLCPCKMFFNFHAPFQDVCHGLF